MTTQNEVQNWIGTLNINHWLIEKHIEGVWHEQTMIQAPYNVNRMNWVVGHLAEHRDWMLRALDETTLMPAKEAMLYRRGSEPVQDDTEVVQLEVLLDYLRRAKECLTAKLSTVDDAFLLEKPQTGILLDSHKDKNRLERIQGLIWHETYHIGQLDLLRQVAGMNDTILS